MKHFKMGLSTIAFWSFTVSMCLTFNSFIVMTLCFEVERCRIWASRQSSHKFIWHTTQWATAYKQHLHNNYYYEKYVFNRWNILDCHHSTSYNVHLSIFELQVAEVLPSFDVRAENFSVLDSPHQLKCPFENHKLDISTRCDFFQWLNWSTGSAVAKSSSV